VKIRATYIIITEKILKTIVRDDKLDVKVLK